MTDLEIPHHDQANSIAEPSHQATGVDPAAVAVLDHLSIAQKAHHHHYQKTEIQKREKEKRKEEKRRYN